MSYENGIMRSLGKFVEIRDIGNKNYLEVKKEMEELGLNMENGIKKSYFEM